jgi:hypothetical protein
MRRSLQLSLIAVFAALHAVLYFVSFGLWRNWAIYIESIEGIILGPQAGFMAAFLGSITARTISPDSFWMFGIIAEPISVLAAGFLSKGNWRLVFAAYVLMLSAYFIHPYGRQLPVWTILDVLTALIIIYPVAKLGKWLSGTNLGRLSVALVSISFVSIATDALVRVFLLVPCGMYNLFFDSFGSLQTAFVAGAVDSYIEDIIVAFVTFLAGVPLIIAITKVKIFQENNRGKKH